ncbi:MAG: uracil-DNA glycosylase [Candidatus Thermoplasmatota archaeon]|nr:uracil-DNA glycosylase [Candidatus Thermoplasmatota archaeon]MCL5881375.1 uracil-DNA glycosylase [Candidatus Thermoplasmatota archaeon]
MQELRELCSEISMCKKCDLYLSRKNAVCGFGSDSPRIMIIGEAPGAREDEVGKPFVGRSGQLLNRALEYAGILPHDLYITNSVRCRPMIGKSPKMGEIRQCSDYLKREITALRPRIMVPMGNTALKSVSLILGSNLGKVSEVEGRFMYLSGHILAPQYHPAAILRNPKRMERFKDNFARIFRLMNDIQDGISNSVLELHSVKVFY